MSRALRTPFVISLMLLFTGTSAFAQSRGMTMDQVRSLRGEPLQVQGPVGDPPITRWIYDDEIIYFEYSLLLTRVAQDNLPQPRRTDGLRITP